MQARVKRRYHVECNELFGIARGVTASTKAFTGISHVCSAGAINSVVVYIRFCEDPYIKNTFVHLRENH